MNVKKKKIRSFEELEYFENKYNVSFPRKWKTKFKIKKRKVRSDELWKDYCIAVYAWYRLFDVYYEINEQRIDLVKASVHVYNELEKNPKNKYLKKLLTLIIKSEKQSRRSTKFSYHIEKKGGKSFYNLNLDSDMIKTLNSINSKIPKNLKFKLNFKIPKNITFRTKMQVIKFIIEQKKGILNEGYWINRKKFKNLPLEDRKNKDIVRREIIAFNKCVMKIRQKKYNKEFFKNMWYRHLGADGERAVVPEVFERLWNLFLKIR